MNKETATVIERSTEGIQINTSARIDANRASKRPSTEVHKVNEAVRLLMAAMGKNKEFESQFSPQTRQHLWTAWRGMNQALSEQELYEREQREARRNSSAGF